MSLYDDVVVGGDLGFTSGGGATTTGSGKDNNQSITTPTSTLAKNGDSGVVGSSDLAGWNNSLKLLQHQVEAAKKRQQSTLNSLVNQKKEKHVASVAPVIDLTEKKKPGLQLRKEPEFIAKSTRGSFSEIRFNAITGKVEKEEVGSIFGTLNEEYDPMRPNDYEKLTLELRRVKQAQEEEARRAERERKRQQRKEEDEKRQRERDRERQRRRRRRHSSDSRSRSRSRSRSSGGGGGDRSSSSSDGGGGGKRKSGGSDKDKKKNALFAPPPSLIAESTPENNSSSTSADIEGGSAKPVAPLKSLFGGLMKAEKMMAKMGYKEGEGLGKNNQGMSMALQVEKTGVRSGRIIHEKELPEVPVFSFANVVPGPPTTSPAATATAAVVAAVAAPLLPPPPPQAGVPSEIMKNMSKCVLLRNMVGPGDVDDELEVETKEECQKYGEVNKVVIFEMPDKPADEAVRIFVEFKTLPSAIKALTDLNGRFFGGRAVKACFYDVDKFQQLQLQEPV